MDPARAEKAYPVDAIPGSTVVERLVFFGIRPWSDLARFGFFRTAGGTFGCLLRSGRFAEVSYVHVTRRWGFRIDIDRIDGNARAVGLPAGLPLGRFALLRRLNRWLQARLLARYLRRTDEAPRLFWLNDWEQIAIAGRLGPGRCLVECQDDSGQVLAGNRSRLDEIPVNRDAALARADLVAAVDPSLLDGLGGTDRHLVLAPNGVSTEFLEAGSRLWPEPPELANRPHPRLVVVAGEWSFERRVDHELLEAAMDRLHGWSLVLVGVPEKPGRLARLVARSDVVGIGARPYLGLVPYLEACDVGAVPYRGPGRRDVLKTYEYLACGLPVVATFDEPRPELAPWVTLAAGLDAFVDACTALSRRGLTQPGPLRAILEEHTWERRTSRLLAALDAARPPGAC